MLDRILVRILVNAGAPVNYFDVDEIEDLPTPSLLESLTPYDIIWTDKGNTILEQR